MQLLNGNSSSDPSDRIKTTFWLSAEGDIMVHTVATDEAGNVFSESGEPSPDGKELSKDAIAKVLLRQLEDERERFEKRETAKVARQEAAIVAHKDKVQQLVDAGMSRDAVKILLPEEPTSYVKRKFSVDPLRAQGLSMYGLNALEIHGILASA